MKEWAEKFTKKTFRHTSFCGKSRALHGRLARVSHNIYLDHHHLTADLRRESKARLDVADRLRPD